MSNYFASEVALTPQTRKLWENKPVEHVYPMPEFDQAYRKPHAERITQDNKPAAKIKIKKLSKVSREALDEFQRNRLFSVIRGMDGN